MTPPRPCSCPPIYVGWVPTETRNWNPDCDEHGVGSAWWNSPEQRERRRREGRRLRRLQEVARLRREGKLSLPEATRMLEEEP